MFYKISNKDILKAKNEQPLNLVSIVEDFLFFSTDEKLNSPFVEVEEKDILFGSGIDLSLNRRNILSRSLAKIDFDFTSDALGENHKYDLMGDQDQSNLTQALLYLRINPTLTANIRCADKDGVKDNRPHTKEQLEKLFSDWYAYKSTILDKYSTLKIDVKTNNPLEMKKIEEENNV